MERLIHSDGYLPAMYGRVITRHHEILLNIHQQPIGFKPVACKDILLDQAQSQWPVSLTYVTLALSVPLRVYLRVVLFTSPLACILFPYLVRLPMLRWPSIIYFVYLWHVQLSGRKHPSINSPLANRGLWVATRQNEVNSSVDSLDSFCITVVNCRRITFPSISHLLDTRRKKTGHVMTSQLT